MTTHQVAELVGGERDGEEITVSLPEPAFLEFPRAPDMTRLYSEPIGAVPVQIDRVRFRRAGLNDRGVRRYILEHEHTGGA